MMPSLFESLPWAFTVALAAASGCAIEYTVPLETDGGHTDGDLDDEVESGQNDDCDPPSLQCEDGCIDPASDAAHCGDCDLRCPPGGSCVDSACIDSCDNGCDVVTEVCAASTCECRLGFTRCGGACVDLDVDPEHCGDCGEECTEFEDGELELYVCQNGNCRDEELGCSPGLEDCGQSCVDLASHPLHCDGCGQACDGDQVCIDGNCLDT